MGACMAMKSAAISPGGNGWTLQKLGEGGGVPQGVEGMEGARYLAQFGRFLSCRLVCCCKRFEGGGEKRTWTWMAIGGGIRRGGGGGEGGTGQRGKGKNSQSNAS